MVEKAMLSAYSAIFHPNAHRHNLAFDPTAVSGCMGEFADKPHRFNSALPLIWFTQLVLPAKG
jgi:hypothetical protein